MSSSPLLFVRDSRTLPFIPVTVAALVAIRTRVEGNRPYALATYMSLLELANEARSDRAAVTQRELVGRVGAGRTSVQKAIADLQTAGVLVVREIRHGSARLENEYVIVEPDQDVSDLTTPPATRATPPPATRAGVARHTGEGRPPGEQLTQEGLEGKKGEKERADPREQAPPEFPDALRQHARIVMETLRRIAEQHGTAKVWPLAVGRVVMQHPRHPLVKAANALELWAVDPPRPIRDVVATYRTFLERERELEATEPLAPDGVPVNGTGHAPNRAADASSGPARMRGMADQLRAEAAEIRARGNQP